MNQTKIEYIGDKEKLSRFLQNQYKTKIFRYLPIKSLEDINENKSDSLKEYFKFIAASKETINYAALSFASNISTQIILTATLGFDLIKKRAVNDLFLDNYPNVIESSIVQEIILSDCRKIIKIDTSAPRLDGQKETHNILLLIDLT